MRAPTILILLAASALPAAGQMDILTAVRTRDYSVNVDTVRFVWELIPDQVFYPDSLGGLPGSTDSAVFTIPILWFPPAVRVHYRANSGPTLCDTITDIVQDSWYVLPAGAGSEPLIRFGRIHGVQELPVADGPRVAAAPNPFRESVRLTAAGNGGRQLLVRDAAGRVVRSLDGQVATWDGRDKRDMALPAGVYLVSCPGTGAVLRLVKVPR